MKSTRLFSSTARCCWRASARCSINISLTESSTASATLTRFTSWLNGLFDNYIIDGMVNAIANSTFWTGNRFRRIQTGNINSYLYGILIAIALAVIVKIRYWS